jgi:NitT/TauT family transport system ATP-binding protein
MQSAGCASIDPSGGQIMNIIAKDTPLVTVKGVKQAYNNGTSVVLDHVDLTLRPAEIVGLLGRSGSGK